MFLRRNVRESQQLHSGTLLLANCRLSNFRDFGRVGYNKSSCSQTLQRYGPFLN